MCLGIKDALCAYHRDMGVIGIPLFEEPFDDREDDEEPGGRFDDDFGGFERRTAG